MKNRERIARKQFLWAILFFPAVSGLAQTQTRSTVTTSSGLRYEILLQGTGAPAKSGDMVQIFETTSYRDGTVLYSNENTGRPVQVLIGGNQATEGVDEGLRGMQTGEVRVLTAPPYLVKRKSYPSNISPDSVLVIRIILHKIL